MGGFIDRIQYFMSQMGINNNQMTVAAGLSVGLIGKAIKLKSGLNSDSIEKILCAYPNLNPTWLLTGKGEMLNMPIDEDKNANPNANPNANLSRENQDFNSQKDVADLKLVCPTTNIPSPDTSLHQQSGNNDIIMNLIEQLKDLSEEIGSLRQENSALKHRLAQLAEDVGSAQDVPA